MQNCIYLFILTLEIVHWWVAGWFQIGEGLKEWGLNPWWAVDFLHKPGEDNDALSISASEKEKRL